MRRAYRMPYKDPIDRTPEIVRASQSHIKDFLEEKGVHGCVMSPVKLAQTQEHKFTLGIAILDTQREAPEELMFFVTPLEKLQLRPLPEDLILIKKESVNIQENNRTYNFEIDTSQNQRLPSTINGKFSLNNMSLDLQT